MACENQIGKSFYTSGFLITLLCCVSVADFAANVSDNQGKSDTENRPLHWPNVWPIVFDSSYNTSLNLACSWRNVSSINNASYHSTGPCQPAVIIYKLNCSRPCENAEITFECLLTLAMIIYDKNSLFDIRGSIKNQRITLPSISSVHLPPIICRPK